jgi:hypothetical protein
MTNLIGTIGFVVLTNWTTSHVENAVCHTPNCKDEHFITYYQNGVMFTNIVLNMEWRGAKKELLLEEGSPINVNRVLKVPSKPSVSPKTNNVPPLLTKPKK